MAGLRREEVAVVAGVNVDYYTRLEQGRERAPSSQMLAALVRALLLDDDARDHLYRLAGNRPPRRPLPELSTVSPRLVQLVHAHTESPAIVLDLALDVLAANRLARALYSPLRELDNLARLTFLEPRARDFYPQWTRNAHAVVANLRHATGVIPDHSRLARLIETLAEGSAEFSALWAGHDVRAKSRAPKQFHHPDVGILTLTYETLEVRASPDQQLIVYQAEPGSVSAERLALLARPTVAGETAQPVGPAQWAVMPPSITSSEPVM